METSRVEAFSDGVFAIAITLLVLDLHPPESGDLWAGLIHEWPQFGAYPTRFVVIGITWANHHSMFRQIVRSDRVLLFLNLGLLLWTSFLPLPTGLVARYLGAGGSNAAVAEALYSANLTLAAIAFSLVWFRAVHRNWLVDTQLTPRQQSATLARFSTGAIVYALTIAVAFAAPAVALAIQFLLALYYLFEQVRPTGADAVTVAG